MSISQDIIKLSKEKQALLFERLKQKRDASKAPTITRREAPREGRLRLSYAQQRLWFIDQLEPGTALYNVPLAIRLSGQLFPEALSAAFTELVRRHEILRTTFAQADGEPVQVIAAASPLSLPVIDLSALDLEQAE